MASREFTDDEKVLIAGGLLAAGAVIGTFIVLSAFGSYKKGQLISENELPSIESGSAVGKDSGHGDCEKCGADDVQLCKYWYGVPELPKNHCIDCGGGYGYSVSGLPFCQNCAAWDYADDD